MKYELHPLSAAEAQSLKAANRGPADYHVRHTDTGWTVARAQATKASAVFATKIEAVSHARKLAASQQVSFKIYNLNGRRAK